MLAQSMGVAYRIGVQARARRAFLRGFLTGESGNQEGRLSIATHPGLSGGTLGVQVVLFIGPGQWILAGRYGQRVQGQDSVFYPSSSF